MNGRKPSGQVQDPALCLVSTRTPQASRSLAPIVNKGGGGRPDFAAPCSAVQCAHNAPAVPSSAWGQPSCSTARQKAVIESATNAAPWRVQMPQAAAGFHHHPAAPQTRRCATKRRVFTSSAVVPSGRKGGRRSGTLILPSPALAYLGHATRRRGGSPPAMAPPPPERPMRPMPCSALDLQAARAGQTIRQRPNRFSINFRALRLHA